MNKFFFVGADRCNLRLGPKNVQYNGKAKMLSIALPILHDLPCRNEYVKCVLYHVLFSYNV